MAMVWLLDLLHLQLQHCPFSPIEALIVSGRPFAISTDSACKKFIWIISYLRFGFSFALYVRMCSLASMWVSQQLSKTFLTVENLWCFHSFFFFFFIRPLDMAVENCRSCIFEFLSCGLYHSQSDKGNTEPNRGNLGFWDSVCGLLIFLTATVCGFDFHKSFQTPLWGGHGIDFLIGA